MPYTMAGVISVGVGGDAVLRDAVVTGEDDHPHVVELPRRALALAGGHPGGQRLEVTERAERLGLPVAEGAGCGVGGVARGLDGGTHEG